MNFRGCSRLDEVRQAQAQGHWPDACAADLHTHVEQCSDCANETLIATHLQQARVQALEAARPGAYNLIWLKAQARSRNAALERIGRPLAAAQAFAFAVILLAIVGVIATHWHSLVERALAPQDSATWTFSTLPGDWSLAPVILAISIITMLGCLAAYLTAERR